jgi:hypothetical protein
MVARPIVWPPPPPAAPPPAEAPRPATEETTFRPAKSENLLCLSAAMF